MELENFIILFIVIPMGTGVIGVLLKQRVQLARVLGVLSFLATSALAIGLLVHLRSDPTGILVSQMGAWPAPFGISVVFDSLSGLLLAASSVVALACYVHSFSTVDPVAEKRYFHPMVQLLMFGVNLAFLTGDLFNLFVSFEIMLMASYCLLTFGGTRLQMTQAYKYVLLNLVGSTLFVIGAGLVYGMTGTLNYADLARFVAERQARGEALPPGFAALSISLLLVFGLKGAIFPLWFWLPDTYYTCNVSIAGLFAGMLTKVGIYAIARTFPMIFAHGNSDAAKVVMPLLAISAAFTMFLGVLGAVSHHNIRRILAVHVISQVGYMVFGLALMTRVALAGCLFYMIQHMVVKSCLFLCCGIVERHTGTDDLDKSGGLLKRDTYLGVVFFIAAMSLVGLPPLSGFFGKLVIIREGWRESMWWLSIFGLLTGALTLLSMLKIWSYCFSSPSGESIERTPANMPNTSSLRPAYVGATLLVCVALFLGFGAQPVYEIAYRAGEQLAAPEAYIQAVLGPEVIADLARARAESAALAAAAVEVTP
ncbi:MAG: hypothetical protein IT430_09950 [Phycisphaerales bacterium]|nr:hypothetical protein [Phycisphaerales bacterium]